MSKWGGLLLVVAASTQAVQAHGIQPQGSRVASDRAVVVAPSDTVPTVTVPSVHPITIPTLSIPVPTATPSPTTTPRPEVRRPVHRKHRVARVVPKRKPTPVPASAPRRQWIVAFLSSYCPGSAGGLSSSGLPVFYGMLANNFYAFGTRVYLPVVGITGVVEDHVGAFPVWNHFDVWSPVCYSTPTGWFRVAVQTG